MAVVKGVDTGGQEVRGCWPGCCKGTKLYIRAKGGLVARAALKGQHQRSSRVVWHPAVFTARGWGGWGRVGVVVASPVGMLEKLPGVFIAGSNWP